jgi:hypothetical protein
VSYQWDPVIKLIFEGLSMACVPSGFAQHVAQVRVAGTSDASSTKQPL